MDFTSTQFSMDTNLTVLYHCGHIFTRENGVWFHYPHLYFLRIKKDITLSKLKQKIEGKVQAGDWHKEVSIICYCKPSLKVDGRIQYSGMTLQSDDALRTTINTHGQYSSVGPTDMPDHIYQC